MPELSNKEITQTTTSPSTDEYEFIDGVPQSLSFDNSEKKTSLQSSPKRRIPSFIPQKPVSMHPTVQFPTQPIDIQFGDVQWNDSVPIAVTPSDNTPVSTTFNNYKQEISSTANAYNKE